MRSSTALEQCISMARWLNLTLLTLTFLVVALTPQAYAQPSVYAERRVEVYLNHLVLKDTITILSAPFNLTFALPTSIEEDLLTIYVTSPSGEIIQPTRLGVEGNLTLFSCLIQDEGRAEVVYTLFNPAQGLNRTLILPLYPILGFDVEQCNVTFTYPQEAYVVQVYTLGVEVLEGERPIKAVNISGPLPPFTLTWLNSTYALNREVEKFICVEALRELNLEPNGEFEASETLTFQGLNPSDRVQVIEFTLPPGVEEVKVRDFFGFFEKRDSLDLLLSANYEVDQLENATIIKVRPRFTLGYGENVTFTVTYHSCLEGTGEVTLPTLPFNDQPILHLTLILHPPPGTTEFEADPPLSLEQVDGSTIAKYTCINLYPPPTTSVTVRFTLGFTLPIALTPMLLVLVVVLVASTFIMVKARRPLPTPTIAEPYPQWLIDHYDEKIAILDKRRRLYRDFGAGKIKRRIYEHQLRALNIELSKLEDRIKELKKKVKEAKPSYVDSLSMLDEIDKELEELEETRRNIESKFRTGKTTRREFEENMTKLSERQAALQAKLREAISKLRAQR